MQAAIKTTAAFQPAAQPLRGCVIPLQNRLSWDFSTPRCSHTAASPLPGAAPATGPAVCAHPTHVPVPRSCPWSYRRGQRGTSRALSGHRVTRCHQNLFLLSLFYWNSVEPTLLPNKANKFNYLVMCLSEQAPPRLTGIKHLYKTLKPESSLD